MTPQTVEPKTVTIPEFAKLLGISRSLGYQAARRGEFPTVRIGRRLLVPRSAIDQLLPGHMSDSCDGEVDHGRR